MSKTKALVYRGFPIHKTTQGNYWSPAFGSACVAANVATMKRWIDQAISTKEISAKVSR